MRYRFIDDHRTLWPIGAQCDVLDVSRSGYYAWRNRPPSAQSQRREELTDRLRAVHAMQHQDVYGAPRVQRELVAQGHPCDRKTVARCIQAAGIQAKTVKKFRVSTTDSNRAHPVAENIADRNFSPSEKNQT